MKENKYRLLRTTICNSKKIKKLFQTLPPAISIKCQMVYTWLIPWADDEGRMRGDIFRLKANIFPWVAITEKELETVLCELHKVGLVVWDEIDEERFLQIEKWKQNQSIRSDSYKPGKFPPHKSSKDMSCPPSDNQVATNGCQGDNLTPTPLPLPTPLIKSKSPTLKNPKPKRDNGFSEQFLEFRNLYDKKEEKEEAALWYEKNIIANGLHQVITSLEESISSVLPLCLLLDTTGNYSCAALRKRHQ